METETFFLISVGLLVLCLFVLEKKIAITPVSFVIGIFLFTVPIKYLFLSFFDLPMKIYTSDYYFYYASIAICSFAFFVMLTTAILSVKNLKFAYLGYRPNKIVINASFFLFLSTCMLVVYRVGLNGLFDPISFRRGLESGGALYLTQLYILTVSLAIVMLPPKRWVFKIIFYGIHFGFCLAAGRTGYLLLYFLNIIFSSNIKRQRNFSFGALISILFLTPLLAVFFLRYRLIKNSSSTITETMFTVIEEFNFTDLSVLMSLVLRRSDHLEHFSNFIGAFIEGEIMPSLQGLGDMFLQFIPRVFMPNKPPTFSTEMTGYFYPEVLDQGVTNNFLGISEFISYFGMLGIILCGIYVGVLVKALSLYAKKSISTPAVYYVMFNLVFLYIFNGVMSGFFNDWALQCLLLNIFYMSFLGRWIVFK